MTSVFQPPPTWALPIQVDKTSNQGTFSPVWLKWFIDLSSNFNANSNVDTSSQFNVITQTVFSTRPPLSSFQIESDPGILANQIFGA